MGRRDKYTAQKNSKYFMEISPLKKVELNSPFLECGLCLVTSFQREYGKGKKEKVANSPSARMSRLIISGIDHVVGMYPCSDVTRMTFHLCVARNRQLQSNQH